MASAPGAGAGELRIGGIAVRVHWSVFLLLALFTVDLAVAGLPYAAAGYSAIAYWSAAVGCGTALLVCLFAHEFSHALVARRAGLPTRRITLWLLGGAAQLEGEARTPRADLAIAAVGPGVSLVCAFVFGGAALLADGQGASRLLVAALFWLGWANAVIGAFNLLPGAPLDGGRILRAALWWRSGDRDRAAATALRAGRVLAAVLVGLGVLAVLVGSLSGLWLVMLGFFIGGAANAEREAARLARIDVTAADVMTPDPVCAPGWYTICAFLDWAGEHGAHQAYPVIDFDGRPAGVIVLGDLARFSVLPADRRVSDVVRPLARVPVLAPGDRAAELLTGTRRLPGAVLALVVEDGRLLGTIALDRLAATIQLASLRQHLVGN